ncbi:hypothetical protein Scep_007005 [Stephania cephalantha]|uniref:Uncharacterized protein n=1 Tax=Stephania cephalantha TaxID=152367 RepID=A0AAP0KAR9_9MAGN
MAHVRERETTAWFVQVRSNSTEGKARGMESWCLWRESKLKCVESRHNKRIILKKIHKELADTKRMDTEDKASKERKKS